ncbi:MAG: biotin synthase BioB [Planctomycetes bacterium]|nr:biotin synthase BioB [Planctomycetota bacterium]
MNKDFCRLLADAKELALAGKGCTREQAEQLCDENIPLDELMDAADEVREKFCGKEISLCVILNARSGACRENCRFCAQSAHNKTDAEIYKLVDADKMVESGLVMKDSGAETFGIVTSGPTVNAAELSEIGKAVARMKGETGMEPCASLGKLDAEQFSELKAKGLKRFHHNLETSRAFYTEICTTHTWDERYETVKAAQAAGLEVCSGGLFGMGESWADRVDLALSLRELGVKSVPVNFLNPVKGTPLGENAPLAAEEGLRVIAIYRLLLPEATIRVCGGRPLVLADRQRNMFRAGANALMTGDYLTTAGITPETDRELIRSLGLSVKK